MIQEILIHCKQFYCIWLYTININKNFAKQVNDHFLLSIWKLLVLKINKYFQKAQSHLCMFIFALSRSHPSKNNKSVYLQPHPFPPNNWDVICTAGELQLQRSVIDEYTSRNSHWDSATTSRYRFPIQSNWIPNPNFRSSNQKQRQTVDSVDPQFLGKHAEQSWGQCAG